MSNISFGSKPSASKKSLKLKLQNNDQTSSNPNQEAESTSKPTIDWGVGSFEPAGDDLSSWGNAVTPSENPFGELDSNTESTTENPFGSAADGGFSFEVPKDWWGDKPFSFSFDASDSGTSGTSGTSSGKMPSPEPLTEQQIRMKNGKQRKSGEDDETHLVEITSKLFAFVDDESDSSATSESESSKKSSEKKKKSPWRERGVGTLTINQSTKYPHLFRIVMRRNTTLTLLLNFYLDPSFSMQRKGTLNALTFTTLSVPNEKGESTPTVYLARFRTESDMNKILDSIDKHKPKSKLPSSKELEDISASIGNDDDEEEEEGQKSSLPNTEQSKSTNTPISDTAFQSESVSTSSNLSDSPKTDVVSDSSGGWNPDEPVTSTWGVDLETNYKDVVIESEGWKPTSSPDQRSSPESSINPFQSARTKRNRTDDPYAVIDPPADSTFISRQAEAIQSNTSNSKSQNITVVAIDEFSGEDSTELTLHTNDVVSVLRMEGPWWKGKHLASGTIGWFPQNYVESLATMASLARKRRGNRE